MKRVALIVIAVLATTGTAQTISGGARFHPTGFTFEATAEYGLNLLGFRLGPIASARAGLEDWEHGSLALIGGLGATITPRSEPWGIQIQLLYQVLFRTDQAPTTGPELIIAGTWHLGN